MATNMAGKFSGDMGGKGRKDSKKKMMPKAKAMVAKGMGKMKEKPRDKADKMAEGMGKMKEKPRDKADKMADRSFGVR